MRYGYFMMPLHPPGSFLADTLAHDLWQVERLDQLGFEEAWIGEHFTAEWENIPSPELFIAAALARTERIKLGTGVTCMPSHNPFFLAHRIAQLDHQARGRFLWGVGTGSFVGDLEVAGIDPRGGTHRGLLRDILVDTLDAVLQLWESPTPGDYAAHGWRYTVPEPEPFIGKQVHVRPYQRPHPPIAVAGVTEGSPTLQFAGERGYIPMSINLVPSRVLQTHWQQVEVGAARTGQHPSRRGWRVCRTIHLAETTEQARREALEGAIGRDFRDYFLRTLNRFNRLAMVKQDPAMADAEVTLEYLLDQVWIVGDPDHVVDRLRQLYRELGGFGWLLAMGHEWSDPTIWERSMTLFAREVLPRLVDLEGDLESEPAYQTSAGPASQASRSGS
jgi:alkanesulfonate monooxygenase SsuD/methylene tetrahydromethanopterin reductase-like flavin-dependent oxidoreductase (luciferase family)